jgi:hypothetical protein
MKMILSRGMLVVAACLGLTALNASATDVTLVNQDGNTIHPYFKSNCWDPAQITGADPVTGWVFFGGVNAHGQFTWTQFQSLLLATCKHPRVKFTFVLDGETPGKHVPRNLRTTIDLSDPVFTITVVDNPVIQPGDSDDDD